MSRLRAHPFLLGLAFFGCTTAQQNASNDEPARAAEPAPAEAEAVRPTPAPRKTPEPAPPTPSERKNDAAPPSGADRDPVGILAKRFEQQRELGRAYLAGTIPEDMVEAKRLIVDGTTLGQTHSIAYMVIPSKLDAEATANGQALRAATYEMLTRNQSFSGDDRGQPLVLHAVEPGDYTACVQLDPKRLMFEADPDVKPICKTFTVADDAASRIVKLGGE